MGRLEILEEIRKLTPDERQAIVVQTQIMNLQDIIVEVTCYLKQMNPAELLSLLDALAPVLSQDLAQLEILPKKSKQDDFLITAIPASLKDYANLKNAKVYLPQNSPNQSRILANLKCFTPEERHPFFDATLLLLDGISPVDKNSSRIHIKRRMAGGSYLALDDYLNDEELTAFSILDGEDILEFDPEVGDYRSV